MMGVSVGEIGQVLRSAGGFGGGHFAGDVLVAAQFLEDLADIALGLAVVAGDGGLDFLGIGHDGNDFLVDRKPNSSTMGWLRGSARASWMLESKTAMGRHL